MSRRRIQKLRHQRGRQQLLEFLSYNETTPVPPPSNATPPSPADTVDDLVVGSINWNVDDGGLHHVDGRILEGEVEQHLVLVNGSFHF